MLSTGIGQLQRKIAKTVQITLHRIISTLSSYFIYLDVYHCVLFSSRFRVRISISIRFSNLLVSGCADVFLLVYVVIELHGTH